MTSLERLRIVFMGTPDFALAALRALHEAGRHEIACVYTQPPRPKGRGQQVRPSPVQEYAQTHGMDVFHPLSLKSAEEAARFAAYDADVAVVAAYGLILPETILKAPRFGCINIHASLLPRWRGASPIQQAIWHGDAQTGVTLMQMDRGLDTGPMIAARGVDIRPETTASTLHDALAALGGEMICAALDDLAARGEKLPAEAQDESASTYAPLLKKEDGRIDWTQDAAQIDRQIRALNPWPGVTAIANGKRLKILAARLDDMNEAAPPGRILDRAGRVTCGGGSVLQLLKIQPEGARPMDVASAFNGGYLSDGEALA